ncbi:hypothetical protein Pve01_94480 [Planomonospora venezuelensis]|nr:hypothetical protein Pve01_94480 [Planomonospora venezuelensis]
MRGELVAGTRLDAAHGVASDVLTPQRHGANLVGTSDSPSPPKGRGHGPTQGCPWIGHQLG